MFVFRCEAADFRKVSGCQLNGSLADLLVPLADTPAASIAASGCGLSGTVPNLIEISVRFWLVVWNMTFIFPY